VLNVNNSALKMPRAAARGASRLEERVAAQRFFAAAAGVLAVNNSQEGLARPDHPFDV
jgi:hypothetical protein